MHKYARRAVFAASVFFAGECHEVMAAAHKAIDPQNPHIEGRRIAGVRRQDNFHHVL